MVLRFSLFAAALLFISCTDFVRDNPLDPEGVNYMPSSSSEAVPSSSSSFGSTDPSKMIDCGAYCLWPEGCSRMTTDPEGIYGKQFFECESVISNCTRYSSGRAIFSDSSCKTVQ